jgi:4-diphosphocytidyl-2-C-methyl-D-erythritol kinase
MITFPHAKVNLGLHITGKRPDGYHTVETVLLPVGLCDALEVVEGSGEDIFSQSGMNIPEDPMPNLCMQAVSLLRDCLQVIPPLQVHLHKRIPAGAGLGGGSADAAYMLRMLSALFDTGLTETDLAGLAARLGSDCPFFLSDGPALATGRGEILNHIALPQLKGMYIILVVPPVHISTAQAYAAASPAIPPIPLREIMALPAESWKETLINDFEPGIFAREPMIRAIREQLIETGALYASMSGSGSGLYGLFREKPSDNTFHLLINTFPDCFVWGGPAIS